MKNKLRSPIFFLIGVFVTTCFFQFIYPPPKDAHAVAAKYQCIATNYIATLRDGNVGEDKKFSIYYTIPTCYAEAGYEPIKFWRYGSRYLAVTYKNSDFYKSSTFGSDSSGGGVVPVGQ